MGSGKKSLKTRPGAMKRKRNLETMERERFEMNMAQMAGMREEYSESVQGREIVRVVGDEGGDGAGTGIGVGEAGPGTGTGTVGTAERWAALRGFIQQTLETRPGMKTA